MVPRSSMNVAVVNYAFAPDVDDPEALLERYSTLTGWGVFWS